MAPLLVVSAMAGCSDSSVDRETDSTVVPADPTALSDQTAETFSVEEVRDASGDNAVTPIYRVSTSASPLDIVLINPGESYETFRTWTEGAEAAASFYGSTIHVIDLDFDYASVGDAMNTALTFDPDAVISGAGAMNVVALDAAAARSVPIVLIDQEMAGAVSFGVPSTRAGELGAQLLVDEATRRAAVPDQITFLGISVVNCEPCDERVDAGAAIVQSALGLADSSITVIRPERGTADAVEPLVVDYLTAHPDETVLVLPFGDGGAVGALNAATGSNAADRVVVTSLGADPAGRSALRDPTFAGMIPGMVDFQSFQQGWNAVEASYAAATGDAVRPYQIGRILNAMNVDTYYPND